MKRNYIIGAFLAMTMLSSSANFVNLRCEYLSEPLGIDTSRPRLSWECDNHDEIYSEIWVEISKDSKFYDAQKFTSLNPNIAVVEIDTIPDTKYYWRVRSKNNKGKEVLSKTATFETGKFSINQWEASWIGDSNDKEFAPAPVFRKTFNVDCLPKDARAYISALGYYIMHINGRRVGDYHMDPGFTSYNKRSLYSTHDITDLLQKGENTIEVTLGNGFANSQSGEVWNYGNAPWRTRPIFICEIQGDSKILASTDSTWYAANGPIVYNTIYSGVHYDGRIKPSFTENTKVFDAPNVNLKSQAMPAIRPIKTLEAKHIGSFGDTIHLYDLGQNIAGVCELRVKGEKGTKIQLAHGELLTSDNRLEQGNINIYYHPVKEDEAFQTDVYIIGNDNILEKFQPDFTYHGFRYVEIRSSKPIPASDILLNGIMMRTALSRNGSFRCSNDLLNKIYDATMLSYEDNIHSIPTDCPQREKNGWTADAHVAIDLGLLNYDGITLYEKWMNDFIDNQLDNGNIAGIIPSPGWGYGDFPGPVWDAALFIVPLALYDYYGDSTAIKKMYPTMLKYMGWLKSLEKEDGLVYSGIGDWLPYDTQTPTDFTSSLYAYADYKMMSRICKILGVNYSKWDNKANEMKERVNSKWFDQEKALYANGSQAAQAISLYWDLVPEGFEKAVAENLNKMVEENNYALDFGLLGSKSVLRMLTKYGYPETAYRMATRTSAPSWGHWIDKGYTTLHETWTLSPEFRDASLNHVFFGDISAWMTNDIAGLNYDAENPGFQNIIIRPTFMENLDWAEAEYHSVRGPIYVRWERNKKGQIDLSVNVPSGSTASVVLPNRMENVGAGKHKFKI